MAETNDKEKKRPDPGAIPKTPLAGIRQNFRTPTARLPSLRTPRDLTLKGPASASKKTFKPNIPVRRDRSKDSGSSASSRSASPSPAKRQRGRGRGRGGRGRRDRTQDLIQTHNSIFEEGPGERLVRRSTTEGFGRSSPSLSKNDFTSTTSLASSFRSLNMKREDREEEDSKNIAELLRDDFVKDSSLAVDAKYIPVRLPLKATLSSSSSSSSSSLQDIASSDVEEPPKIKIKQEPVSPVAGIKIKQEPLDSDSEMKSVDDSKDTPKLATGGSHPKKSEHALFTRRGRLDGKLLFFQLPDSLPALPPSGDYDGHRGPDVPGTSSQSAEQPEVKSDCTLEDLPPGFLGKLRVRKSGKTELQLGKITLDVNIGTPCGFLQDLVSIRDIGKEKEMINLGQVKHRIICTPNLLSLLNNR